MFHKRLFCLTPISAMILVLLALGCSSGNPIGTNTDLTSDSQTQNLSETGNHQCWGEFVITVRDIEDDEGNPIDVELDIRPLRSSSIHVNVTAFVQPPNCNDCVKIQPVSVVPGPQEMEIVATVFLRNPVQITGYDVRGIIYPEEWGARLEDINGKITYDGLTTLYSDGEPQAVNPYMAFNKETQFRPFNYNETWGASYVFMKDNDYKLMEMVYKIDASWPANAAEAVGCYIPPLQDDDVFYPEGSNAMILAMITDWQNDIDSVTLDLSKFGVPTPVEMVKYDDDPGNYTSYWQYLVTQPGGSPVGPRYVRMTVYDEVESLTYMYDIKVYVTDDDDPPKWLNEGEEGIYDHIASPDGLWLFYYEAWDVSLPIQYIFYGNDQSTPFDGEVLKVENQDTYTGYTEFGSGPGGGAPDNEQRWFGIRLQDGPGFKDNNMLEYICTRYTIEKRWEFIKDQPPGHDGILGSPTIGDVNGDGVDDIVVGTRNHKVYVYGGQGTGTQDTVIWEYETGGEIQCTPALVDLNSDNKLDVVIASDDVNVYALNGATGLPLWTYPAGGGFLMHASPSIAYLNGDDVPDVVIGTGGGKMLALNGAGPPDPGDPQSQVIWSFETVSGIASTPAVADVTGDGIWDVCFGAYDTRVHMVNGATGEEIWNYYIGPGMNNIDCSPVLVDVNGDDVPDCIIGARDNSGLGGTLFAINGVDGPGGGEEIWRQDQIWGNPRRCVAPVHIDDDVVWDFILCAYQTEQFSYYAISGVDGSFIYSKMVDDVDKDTPFNYSPPIVGDFTGDRHMNFAYGRQDGYIDIINLKDFDLPGEWAGKRLWKVVNTGASKPEIYNTPAIADVDNDGELELIVCNMRGYTTIHDMHAPVPDDISLFGWTQHSGNRWNTGTPEFVPPQ